VTNRLHIRAGRNTCAVPSPSTCACPASSQFRAGFSVLELIFVLAIATAITALLMPIFSVVRESAQRVICASNERQIGMAMIMYTDANRDALPPSAYGTPEFPDFQQQDMMAAHRGDDPLNWEGIGYLYSQHYCNSAECFYCPSHSGEHSYDRYERWYPAPLNSDMIFTNYHYAGAFDRSDQAVAVAATSLEATLPLAPRRPLEAGTVLLSDGMRTARDFNHTIGMNILRGDGSVRWRDDKNEVYPLLPRDTHVADNTNLLFTNIWAIIIASESE
jgi:type II secretory pathway pseudopilin PulG